MTPFFLQPLFVRPDDIVQRGLSLLPRVLDEIMPLNASHRRDLPFACRDLSAMLTTEREELDRPYWVSPRLTSAYLRYFLPWNLVRLTALLPNLDLGTPSDIPDQPLIFDIGSGPMTLPLALWLSRPDLRRLPVTVVCADASPHALELGRRILNAMFLALPGNGDHANWTIRTLRTSLLAAPRQLRGKPWLVMLGNVLNELEDKNRPGQRQKPGMQQRLSTFLDDMAALLPPEGRLFAVEPGTRQGGRLISNLRRLALEARQDEHWDKDDFEDDFEDDFGDNAEGDRENKGEYTQHSPRKKNSNAELPPPFQPDFTPLSPCPHSKPCPMLERGVTAWCHINAPAWDVPSWLHDLSRKAGLDKDSVSLSFLFLRRNSPTPSKAKSPYQPPALGHLRTRIVSEPFTVPTLPGRARYACSAKGLTLVADSARLPAGCLCDTLPTQQKDGKSRAIIAVLPAPKPEDSPKNSPGTSPTFSAPGSPRSNSDKTRKESPTSEQQQRYGAKPEGRQHSQGNADKLNSAEKAPKKQTPQNPKPGKNSAASPGPSPNKAKGKKRGKARRTPKSYFGD